MSNLATILLIAALTLVILVIRFVVRAVVNKSADAIHNAVTEKKNRDRQMQSGYLSDKYRSRY